jgi:type I site-specific restriction-modification system R (restriction) subunit
VEGLVQKIDKNAQQLKDAIEDGTGIIITTLQKFPVIYKEVKSRNKRFAIIIDEAHSSQSGDAAKKLKRALADTQKILEEYAEMENEDEAKRKDDEDKLLDELAAQNQTKRVFTLVYNVDFQADSSKNVTVGYKTVGTMDKTKTAKPVYTFDYILNPAKNWSSFGDLDIEIITPKKAPYIVDSSVEMAKENDGHYRASLGSLPEKDLTFSIYEDKKTSPITLFDKAHRSYGSTGILIISAVAIIVVIGFVMLIVLSRRKNNTNQP